MNQDSYTLAKTAYSAYGIDTDAALAKLHEIPISIHCWQGDDVIGFDHDGGLTGGIQTTGNYPGRATTPDELMADIEKAFSLIPGVKKLNLHASYAIFDRGDFADRDALLPCHFQRWVDFAKKLGIGLDFNPTYFSHPKAESGTLSSPDEEIRRFWVRHTVACIRIAEYFAEETGYPCLLNIWIPDGCKETPADRLSPRARFAKSLDEALSAGYDKSKVLITLESKVFGIGLESYTVGSAEFCQGYTSSRHILPLMDSGHYHPTEMISDKISSQLLFHDKLALHISRPVRWDSDHVVRFDDELREIAKEVIASGRTSDILLALDYFDASVNRIAAWVIGARNLQKALLEALLTPHSLMAEMQKTGDFTSMLYTAERLKDLPLGAVWEHYLAASGLSPEYLDEIRDYEQNVLFKR